MYLQQIDKKLYSKYTDKESKHVAEITTHIIFQGVFNLLPGTSNFIRKWGAFVLVKYSKVFLF